jgi:hypothetical protein
MKDVRSCAPSCVAQLSRAAAAGPGRPVPRGAEIAKAAELIAVCNALPLRALIRISASRLSRRNGERLRNALQRRVGRVALRRWAAPRDPATRLYLFLRILGPARSGPARRAETQSRPLVDLLSASWPGRVYVEKTYCLPPRVYCQLQACSATWCHYLAQAGWR